ncbi:phosphoglycerate dehydrogenase [candidate division KSB3 bacterium]|uniref:Phosphoglycerate dehydrogenase n=1 Tax=candidate division KSB3 bacterium TaxID=2044937 RepID=A0A2G6E282_9BACT|nr:MAG: phosphoglycerate dehydrogenase [candidate division KSB3 bacterium]PIE28458.1 MAG: phosphoglycerate dehydrogenase [candidate division KSB3 bacterium]
MAQNVLIPQPIAEEGRQYLRDRGYNVKTGSAHSVEVMKEEVKGCCAILIRTALLPAEVLRAGKELRVIGRHGVGVDNIDIAAATELGIHVTNAPESNSNSVAEQTLGLMLACARNYSLCNREIRKGNFAIRDQVHGVDMQGKTVGIIGLGAIGSRVAQKAILGFDMKVIAYDPYVTQEHVPANVVVMESWEDIFQTADFITLHLPASPHTTGCIGKKEFELMKSTAYLINAARGELVNEADLIEALQQKTIAGAGLDVFEQEPPVRDNLLLELDNVMLTPHNASLTKECMIRMAVHAAMGIDDVLSGRAPKWPVNDPTALSDRSGQAQH